MSVFSKPAPTPTAKGFMFSTPKAVPAKAKPLGSLNLPKPGKK